VDSALGQTYTKKEVIVVDDGSTDDIAEILQPYVREQKIIYIHQENKGLPAARNTGIKASHGEFIALLDSDDIFLPNKIERQVAYLRQHPDCGVCYCDMYQFYEEEPERLLKLDYTYYSGDDVFPNLLRMNFIGPLTVVLRKSEIDRVGLFDETYRRSEDWEYWVRLAQHGVRFEHLPEMLAKYRMRRMSASHDWKSEIQRKATTLQIIEAANAAMTSEERRRYGMTAILRMHRGKLWYAYAGTYFPPLRWLLTWRQKNRLK
jgi:glycosyltransferase involved in cell wall biosynthesis